MSSGTRRGTTDAPAWLPTGRNSPAVEHGSQGDNAMNKSNTSQFQSLRCLIARCLIALFLTAVPALCQITTGTILGTITDPSGALIPGATITAAHLETGAVRTAVSDASGNYTLAALPIGPY